MIQTNKQIVITKHNYLKDDNNEKNKVLRAAAYCRVSTLQEEQEYSFDSQALYYRTYIETNPNLTLVDIYGDYGLSGLHMETRPELQRLINDCMNEKIDVIYTKSISRIARNASECQRLLDRLHNKGVYIFFEKEKIRSNDERLRLVLKLLASFAQEQSNSQSQAIHWAIDANAAIGRPVFKTCYGYRKSTDKNKKHMWIIHKEEANHVKMMFNMIEEGGTSYSIAKRMNEIEKENGGSFIWYSGKVCGMLKNIEYMGDILTNKTIVMDYLSGKAVKNNGIKNQYYIQDHHKAIIHRAQFNRVQTLMTNRRKERCKKYDK